MKSVKISVVKDEVTVMQGMALLYREFHGGI